MAMAPTTRAGTTARFTGNAVGIFLFKIAVRRGRPQPQQQGLSALNDPAGCDTLDLPHLSAQCDTEAIGAKEAPDRQIDVMTMASFLATAILALGKPTRARKAVPQVFRSFSDLQETSKALAALYMWVRVSLLPILLILPARRVAPDCAIRGVRPRYAGTLSILWKRAGFSIAL